MRTTSKMSLASWDQLDDNYNYAQLAGNWQKIDFHDHSPGRGVPIAPGGLADGAVTKEAIAAGVVGGQHLAPALVQDLGLNAGTNIGRGYWSHAATDTVNAALSAPAFLANADRVLDIQLQSSGLIEVDYQALWKVSGGSNPTGYAVLMIAQPPYTSWAPLPIATPNASTATADMAQVTGASHWSPLSTGRGGLVSNPSATADTPEIPTGQALGVGAITPIAASGARLNPVVVASTTSITFGPGNSISRSASGLFMDGMNLTFLNDFTIDLGTVTSSQGIRVLLKNQVDPSQNGIWIYQEFYPLADNIGLFTRPADYANGQLVTAGSNVFVSLGNTQAGQTFAITNPPSGSIVVNTNGTQWTAPGNAAGQTPAGGSAKVSAPAGTYGIGVAYATSGGGATVSAQNRHLWVKAENYA